jgi:hypothetical protein
VGYGVADFEMHFFVESVFRKSFLWGATRQRQVVRTDEGRIGSAAYDALDLARILAGEDRVGVIWPSMGEGGLRGTGLLRLYGLGDPHMELVTFLVLITLRR